LVGCVLFLGCLVFSCNSFWALLWLFFLGFFLLVLLVVAG